MNAMKYEKTLLSGNTAMLLLALLKDRDMYGYEIIEELARRSDDTFRLKEGTLYPLLHSLEKERCVETYTVKTPAGRERKYYHLTDIGRGQLEEKTKEWRLFSEKVSAVIGCTSPTSL